MIKNQNIAKNNVVAQTPGNIVSDMDGEKVMLSIHNGKYYNLGEVGGRIWELIEEAASIDSLVNSLLNEYTVDKSECEEQVISFLEMLHKEDLVQIKE